MSSKTPVIRKKYMKNLESIYGNGAVYVSDGHMVAEFPGHNFDICSLDIPVGSNYWLDEGIAVALGVYTNQAGAVLALKRIIRKINATPKAQFNPERPW